MTAVFSAAANVVAWIFGQLFKLIGYVAIMLLRWTFSGSALTILVKLAIPIMLLGILGVKAGFEDFAAPIMFVVVLFFVFLGFAKGKKAFR